VGVLQFSRLLASHSLALNHKKDIWSDDLQHQSRVFILMQGKGTNNQICFQEVIDKYLHFMATENVNPQDIAL